MEPGACNETSRWVAALGKNVTNAVCGNVVVSESRVRVMNNLCVPGTVLRTCAEYQLFVSMAANWVIMASGSVLFRCNSLACSAT